MNAVVLGSWGIGQAVLKAALETKGVKVVAVFTRPRDETSSDPYRNLVADLAQSAAAPVYPPRATVGAEGIALLESLNPDVVLSAAHPTLMSPGFLAVARHGTLNLHGSLLPRNRGTSPVNWALIRDEPETGLTLHYIDAGMDTGDVIYQEPVAISDDDLPGTLSDRIKSLAAPMIQRALHQLLDARHLPRAGQDGSRATYAPRLKGDDLLIDWNLPARQVWSFVRGTSQPGLGARVRCNGDAEAVIWHSAIGATEAGGMPGDVLSADEEWISVACAEGTLRVSAKAFEPGANVRAGMRFTGR